MRSNLHAVGLIGSAALILAALGFQYIGGLVPCELCIWQRWPHVLAVVLGLAYVIWNTKYIPVAALASMLVCAAIAGYHGGVEQNWWKGLEACAGESLVGMSGEELLDLSAEVDFARCDDIAWSFLGLSMAVWNGLLSLVLAAFWGAEFFRQTGQLDRIHHRL